MDEALEEQARPLTSPWNRQTRLSRRGDPSGVTCAVVAALAIAKAASAARQRRSPTRRVRPSRWLPSMPTSRRRTTLRARITSRAWKLRTMRRRSGSVSATSPPGKRRSASLWPRTSNRGSGGPATAAMEAAASATVAAGAVKAADADRWPEGRMTKAQ